MGESKKGERKERGGMNRERLESGSERWKGKSGSKER